MRRIILLSSNSHPHSNHRHHDTRQRRFHGSDRITTNSRESCSGTTTAHQRRPAVPSSSFISNVRRKGRLITRTRSESDLIRAVAKRREDYDRKRGSDSEDEDSSYTDEDDSRHATSLRSFTKEDEERHARAFMQNVAFHSSGPCTKIGEEEEVSSCTEGAAKENLSTVDDDSPPISESASAVQSSVSPVSDPIYSSHHSESQSNTARSAPTCIGDEETRASKRSSALSTVSPLKDEGTRFSELSGSDNGDTSVTSDDYMDSEVDVEYLQHENDLLKKSLEEVSREREFLARENWNMKIEMERLKEQMRFMMLASRSPPMLSSSGSSSSYTYLSGSPPMYITDTQNRTPNFGHIRSQTFEELLNR